MLPQLNIQTKPPGADLASQNGNLKERYEGTDPAIKKRQAMLRRLAAK